MSDIAAAVRSGIAAFAVGVGAFSSAVCAAAPIVFSAGGNGDPASISGTVNAFRAALGSPNNGNAPALASGRREINWDGGGSFNASFAGTPFTGFQARGATFLTPGTGFIQSPIDILALQFNLTYLDEFSSFSPLRVFTPLGSNIMDVTFSVPGSNGSTPAAVTGFGAVFSDVDLANTTKIEFFGGLGGVSLGMFFVPPGQIPDASLSFLGVSIPGEAITRVRITTGSTVLGPTDGDGTGTDVVVMDDFLFSEPQAVVTGAAPVPATLALLGLGLAGLGWSRRRK